MGSSDPGAFPIDPVATARGSDTKPSALGVSAFTFDVQLFRSCVHAFPRCVHVLTRRVHVFTFHVSVFTFHVSVFTSRVSVFTSRVSVFTSRVGVFTSHVGVFTSHVSLFTSHVRPIFIDIFAKCVEFRIFSRESNNLECAGPTAPWIVSVPRAVATGSMSLPDQLIPSLPLRVLTPPGEVPIWSRRLDGALDRVRTERGSDRINEPRRVN